MKNPLSRLLNQLGFSPSSYPTDLAATTTEQAVDITALEGKGIRFRNMDATNQIRVAFGPDSATAITNAAKGCVIDPGQMEILQPPDIDKWIGYRAVAATASINYQPGW